MNAGKLHKFVTITASGRARNYEEGAHYFSVLRGIADEYGSAGGTWDRPEMLLMDGKIVVQQGLAEIAWEYGRFCAEERKKTEDLIKGKYLPEWLK